MTRRRWRPQRVDLLALVGVAILLNEALIAGTDRPYLIGAAVSLCLGLPLIARAEQGYRRVMERERSDSYGSGDESTRGVSGGSSSA